MSPQVLVERRQTPRANVTGGECRLDVRARVRLLDISLGGVLIGADLALPVGASGQLHSTLGGGPLQSGIQVRRTVDLGPEGPLKGFGASFTLMDERSQRSLEEFLRKASH